MRDYKSLIACTDTAYQLWLLQQSDDVLINNDVICLFSKQSIPEQNEINEMGFYLPNHILIGNDSGDKVFVLEFKEVSPVWGVDAGSLRLEDLEELSSSFSAWRQSGFILPEEDKYHLPLHAEIHIDRVQDLKTLFSLKNFLALNWSAVQMKSLLKTQPFLAIEQGAPIAIEQKLKKNENMNYLKRYIFYKGDDELQQICS